MSVDPATRLLRNAACLYLEPERVEQLSQQLAAITDWNELARQSEQAGLSNILYHHIKSNDLTVAPEFLLQLKALTARHRRAHRVRTRALVEILEAFGAARIESILLKGAALARMLYPEPEFRPMGDIDILVPVNDALRGQQVLRDLGYNARDSQSGYLFDHHHLPGATRTMDGIVVLVEIHRNALSGDAPGSVSFDTLNDPPLDFCVEGRPAKSLGHLDQLRHLCRHAFEPVRTIKLGAIADIYTYLVRFEPDIPWKRLAREHRFVLNTLHCLHYVRPLPTAVANHIGTPTALPPRGVGEGFVPLSDVIDSDEGLFAKLRTIFQCPEWWLHVAYEVPPGKSLVTVKLIRHPARVAGWLWRRLTARVRSRGR